MSTAPKRPFSTSARVYPSYLPYVAASRRVGARVVPVAAVAVVAAGTVLARNKITQKREEWEATAAQAELEARESAERYNRLQDAYAGRTSLTELEAAAKVYEESRE